MTDDSKSEKPPVQPSFIAYHVRENGEGKSYFNRVGSAFAHKDGKGFNLQLDSVPVDGRVTLRSPLERLAAVNERKDRQRSNNEPER